MSIIAITGTPGVGKTTIVELLSAANFTIISVKDLAKQYDCEGDFDEATQSMDIDIHRLAEQFETESLGDTIVDGHLSHLLDVDAIIILRCKPSLLQERLAKRGYSEPKITANVEWEMIAGTWSEIIEFELDQPILELDTTNCEPEELYEAITQWINDGYSQQSTHTRIDWLAE
jgi:adenylate kinase